MKPPLTLDILLSAYRATKRLVGDGELPTDAYISETKCAAKGQVYQIDLQAAEVPGTRHLWKEINEKAGYVVRYVILVHPETMDTLAQRVTSALHPTVSRLPQRQLASEICKMLLDHHAARV